MNKRAWEDDAPNEADSRLPSGRWAGYWQQDSQRGRMQLDLTFGGGRLFGDGRDLVGDFVLSGSYAHDPARVSMHKSYLGGHGVDYDGVATADGIRGTWTIIDTHTGRIDSRGPFYIWPVSTGDGAGLTLEAQVPLAIGTY